MPRYNRKDVILAKEEVSYGTDPTPTGAANAILVRNLNMQPLEQSLVPRDVIRAFFGNSENLPGQMYGICEFEVELQGSGTAGTAPKFGPLLKACLLKETVTAATRVVYAPSSDDADVKSVMIYGYADGVLHKFTGSRGSVAFEFPNQGIPVARFRFFGQYSTPTDASPTGTSYTGWVKPVIVNATNTTPFTLHSASPVTASISVDLANNVVYRDYVGGSKQVLITNREPVGQVSMEAVLVATKNWFDIAEKATLGALALTHGLVAGAIVKLAAPNVQLARPRYGDSDGIKMIDMDMILVPGATGNDELTLTFE